MLKLTVALVFSSPNDVHGIPGYLREPALQSFTGWDCEPRGVLGFIEGYISALSKHVPHTDPDTLNHNGHVRLAFEESEDGEIFDSLVLSMSLFEAPLIFKCWIATQSSKCLTWASCEQVAEEFSATREALGTYVLQEESFKETLKRLNEKSHLIEYGE